MHCRGSEKIGTSDASSSAKTGFTLLSAFGLSISLIQISSMFCVATAAVRAFVIAASAASAAAFVVFMLLDAAGNSSE